VTGVPFGPYSATVVSIHDGDTLNVDIVLVHDRHHRHDPDRDLGFNVHEVSGVGIVLERQAVRLVGCDAPELRTTAGKAALAFLETILKVGDTVTVVSVGWDKYGGRVDGKVRLADGRDLTAVMIDAGHAAAWDGQGPRPG
jgi:micrococcal nuclease